MVATLALAAVLASYPDDVSAAKADYAFHPTARYLYVGTIPERERAGAMQALCFWLPHLSRGAVLEHQRPEAVTPTLYRVDLELLGWGTAGWQAVCRQYPYALYEDSLILRADWLLWATSDTTETTAYYDLLYGGKTPANRDEFLKFWAVDTKTADPFKSGTVLNQGRSGVAKHTRLLVHTPTVSGDLWETFDSREGAGDFDPAENLAGGLKFDASELIVSVPKFDLASGERGRAQAYMLFDGKGKRIDEADVAVVEDYSKFLHRSNIRTPGSCVQCHPGLNQPAENTLRRWIEDGVELSAQQQSTQEFIERFYLSKQGILIERATEDFDTFCDAACGVPAVDAIAAWRHAVEVYDDPISLERAAVELGATDAKELQLALAWYSHQHGPQPRYGRFAVLAKGEAIPRKAWQGKRKGDKVTLGVWQAAAEALKLWRAKP